MHVEIVKQISQVEAEQWNALNPDNNPFLSHAFFNALERHQCVGENHGWLPRHLVATEKGVIQAAMPLYLKDNSYGEFVFDFAWADAYHRAGFHYYPKLVSAIPYTPITTPCVLTLPGLADDQAQQLKLDLFEFALTETRTQQLSGLHLLFPPETELAALENTETIRRLGVQFHWRNQNYSSFEDFLAQLSANKRKKIKRDRRFVEEAGVQIELVMGDQANDQQISLAEHYYRTTFEKKWGYPTLNLGFFKDICQTIGDQVLFYFASQDDEVIACAICFRSDTSLYGRHWGCDKTIHGLHFELCYHQGIEYCIEHQLACFEPGAQGEHKISRGFLPTLTYSSHWIAHPQFRHALQRHCRLENQAHQDYFNELMLHSPFRKNN